MKEPEQLKRMQESFLDSLSCQNDNKLILEDLSSGEASLFFLYEKDYFARLFSVGISSLFEPLLKRYEKGSFEKLLSSYLRQTKVKSIRLEDVFLGFPRFLSLKCPQDKIYDEVQSLIELYNYMHFWPDTKPAKVASFDDFERIFLKKDIFFYQPTYKNADIFGLFTGQKASSKDSCVAVHKMASNEPFYLEVSPLFSGLFCEMLSGQSFARALEKVDDGVDHGLFSGFCHSLSSFLYHVEGD